MELSLLVYVISILFAVKVLLWILVIIIALMCDQWMNSLKTRVLGIASMFLLVAITALLPSERTAYLMVGAYAAQKVYENPTVERLSNKVIQGIEANLDTYIKEAENTARKKLDGL